MKNFFALGLLFISVLTQAQISTDTVTITNVHDGDSYKILKKNGESFYVRLAYVDCPELISKFVSEKQIYGDSATKNIRTLISGRKMLMQFWKYDIYGRKVVSLQSIDLAKFDLARLIISQGWGWYMATSGIPKPHRIVKGKKLQDLAFRNSIGLWQFPNPINPKVWRKIHKPKSKKV